MVHPSITFVLMVPRAVWKRFLTFLRILCLVGLILAGLPQRVAAQDLPPEVYISGFVGHPQSYSLSCESRSAADVAGFWGSLASETEILQALGVSDNPEVNFAGNVHGMWGAIPPNGYGVHAAPIARVLREFGLPAEAYRGMTWDGARAHLAGGRPVIVWIIGGMWAGTPVVYNASDGQTVTVARYEHTMTLVGYSPGLVHVVDSYSGLPQTFGLESFLTSWAVLGNQAVVVHGQPASPPERPAEAEAAAGDTLATLAVQGGDTLAALALSAGISWQELAAYNQIAYPYTIYAGQTLKLPARTPLTSGPTEPENQPVVSEPDAEEAEIPEPSLPAPEERSPETYQVRAGDTLVGLARTYGTSWQAIAEVNGLAYPFFIYPGQVLALPDSAQFEEADQPPAAPDPVEAQPEPEPQPAPISAAETYQVQPGEYLMDLADRFQMDWRSLADLNGIAYPYTIYPGQTLVVR